MGCGLDADSASRPTPSLSLGFTLAEVLVVSVIVAILAAVAVPVYTGYLNDQKAETAENLANTAAVAAYAYFKRTGNMPLDAGDLDLFLPDARFSVSLAGEIVTVQSADGTIVRNVDFIP